MFVKYFWGELENFLLDTKKNHRIPRVHNQNKTELSYISARPPHQKDGISPPSREASKPSSKGFSEPQCIRLCRLKKAKEYYIQLQVIGIASQFPMQASLHSFRIDAHAHSIF